MGPGEIEQSPNYHGVIKDTTCRLFASVTLSTNGRSGMGVPQGYGGHLPVRKDTGRGYHGDRNGSQGNGVKSKHLFRSSQGFSTPQCIGELMKGRTDPALARCAVPECHGISHVGSRGPYGWKIARYGWKIARCPDCICVARCIFGSLRRQRIHREWKAEPSCFHGVAIDNPTPPPEPARSGGRGDRHYARNGG